MRTLLRSLVLSLLAATPALAQEEAHAPNLLSPNYGLMFWTLIIFVVLAVVLTKFAFGPITKAVEALADGTEPFAAARMNRGIRTALTGRGLDEI